MKLRVLVARTSVEVFGNEGEVSITSCILPPERGTHLNLHARGGSARIREATVRKLRPALQ